MTGKAGPESSAQVFCADLYQPINTLASRFGFPPTEQSAHAAHPTRRLLRLFLKLNEISRLEDDRVRSQLRGRQAGGDGGTQEVHRRRGGQAEELALRRPGPCTEKTGCGCWAAVHRLVPLAFFPSLQDEKH